MRDQTVYAAPGRFPLGRWLIAGGCGSSLTSPPSPLGARRSDAGPPVSDPPPGLIAIPVAIAIGSSSLALGSRLATHGSPQSLSP